LGTGYKGKENQGTINPTYRTSRCGTEKIKKRKANNHKNRLYEKIKDGSLDTKDNVMGHGKRKFVS